MNISFNWLKNYVDTTLSAEEISKVLTDIGLEVEGFEKITQTLTTCTSQPLMLVARLHCRLSAVQQTVARV